MRAVVCPKCGSSLVGRTQRSGMFERLASLGYLYPFRCQVCRRRFRRFRWRERYVRVHLDRRDLERIPTRIPVVFHWKDGGQGQGTICDISAAGCGAETDAAVPVGTLVLLQMSPEGEPPIDVDVGEVRSRQARRIGVRFVRVGPAHEERLRQMIQRLIATPRG
jgi:c-di-GMP-binding flagellar brake protein YcgR